MKITKVEAIPYRLPVRRVFKWAGLEQGLGSFVLVRVTTDSGLQGHGEAIPLPDWGGDWGRKSGETPGTVIELVRTLLGPALIGHDPTEVERAHATMDGRLRGNTYAKAAIDMALHDIWGKAAGLPVHRLLGGAVREGVRVAHMVGLMPEREAMEEAAAAVKDGVTALQIKGGVDAARDVRLVKALRQELGRDVFLRLDANQGYRRAKRALAVLAEIGPGVIDMLEQPVMGHDEMAAVTAAATVPVIADESCWDARDALELVQARAADAISIYLAKAGGIAKARRVAAIAEAAGMGCDVNGSIESGVGNAANVQFALATPVAVTPSVIPITAPAGTHPNAVGGHYFEDDIVTEPFKVSGGMILPLTKPGLGVEVDEGKLAKYRLD